MTAREIFPVVWLGTPKPNSDQGTGNVKDLRPINRPPVAETKAPVDEAPKALPVIPAAESSEGGSKTSPSEPQVEPASAGKAPTSPSDDAGQKLIGSSLLPVGE